MVAFYQFVNEFIERFERLKLIIIPKSTGENYTVFKKTIGYEGLRSCSKQKSAALLVKDSEILLTSPEN